MQYEEDEDEQRKPIKVTPFIYPDESEPSDTPVKDDNIVKLLDFITYYVLTDANPKLCLIALCFAAGYDVGKLYNCNNTIRAIAKENGIVYNQLSRKIQEIEKELGLKPRANNK